MKKILLALFIVSTVSVTSCKKDVEIEPAKSFKVGNGPSSQTTKTDVQTWE